MAFPFTSVCNLVHVYICNLDDSRCVMAYLSITPYIIIWCIAPCRNGVFDLLFGLLQLSLIYYNFKRPVGLVFLLNETLIVCSDTGVHHKWDELKIKFWRHGVKILHH